MTSPLTTSLLERHIRAFWPRRRIEDFEWGTGPVSARLPGFAVSRIAPTTNAEPWVYVSKGASRVFTGTDQARLEFVITSPSEDPVHVETLAMVSNFHADPLYRVSIGKVLEIGRPWMDGSPSNHLLVSLPYPFGPELEICPFDRGVVRFLWLVPITPAEASFARTHGYESLEERFEHAHVDTLDVHRSSVV